MLSECVQVPGSTFSALPGLFQLHYNPMSKYHHYAHFTQEKTGLEKFGNLPKVTQLISGIASPTTKV